MLDAAFSWAKEYGDVLGSIGFLFAMFTVIVTNGRVILQRLKGEQPDFLAQGISPNAINMPSSVPATTGAGSGTGSGTGLVVDAPPPAPDYGGKVPVAVFPPTERGDFADHFADGLADDLIAELQRNRFATPEVGAVAAMQAAGADTKNIARDLGVEHVLTTSIRRQQDKIRITAQLIGPSGAVLWSDRFNAVGDDMMAMQESIAVKMATAVASELDTSNVLKNPETGVVYKTREEALIAIASPKSRLTALLLCIPPLGIFGIHRFYLGRPFTAILYPFTGGLFVFGWLIDTALIALGTFADGKGRPVSIWRHDPLKKLKN